MEICRLEHVKKEYRMGETVCPLKDVNMSVNSGDFIAVEGVSGTGKSTLLSVMGLLLEKDGEIIWIEAVGAAEGYAAKPNFPALELTVTDMAGITRI